MAWKLGPGARVEVLLVRRTEPNIWQALGRPGRRLRVGAEVMIGSDTIGARIEIIAAHQNGLRTVRLSDEALIERLGELPLPPYIKGNSGRPQPLPNGVR